MPKKQLLMKHVKWREIHRNFCKEFRYWIVSFNRYDGSWYWLLDKGETGACENQNYVVFDFDTPAAHPIGVGLGLTYVLGKVIYKKKYIVFMLLKTFI